LRDDVGERAAVVVAAEAAIPEPSLAAHSGAGKRLAGFFRERLVLAIVVARRRRLDLDEPHLEAGIEPQHISVSDASDPALLARREIAFGTAAGCQRQRAEKRASPGGLKQWPGCPSHPSYPPPVVTIETRIAPANRAR